MDRDYGYLSDQDEIRARVEAGQVRQAMDLVLNKRIRELEEEVERLRERGQIANRYVVAWNLRRNSSEHTDKCVCILCEDARKLLGEPRFDGAA